MKDFPHFIIAGAAKSGTTALHNMLDQHSEIYMSGIKETNFFVYAYETVRDWCDHSGFVPLEALGEHDIIDSLDKYRALFKAATTGQLLGESSPLYLLNSSVPERMYGHNPDLKIILILRNPADVAYANFVHQIRDSTESLSLGEIDSIFDESHYQKDNLHPFSNHLALPEYSLQLPYYIEHFAADKLHIMIYEEFLQDKRKSLAEVFEFLEVSKNHNIDVDKKVNISAMPKNKAIQNAIRGNAWWKTIARVLVPIKPRRKIRAFLESVNAGNKPVMSSKVRMKFDHRYKKDREFVESFLNREIPVWKSKTYL